MESETQMKETCLPAPCVRGRFAPSPSGRMHLGNIWCALLAWLSVRSQKGSMILRIEDLDTDRCRPEYAEQLMDDLHWLGLDWDEGPDQKQTDAPYFQSECAELYEQALKKISHRAQIYPCYCSRADLHTASAPHLSDGTVLYSGRCRHLSQEQRKTLEQSGRRPSLRISVGGGGGRWANECYADRTRQRSSLFYAPANLVANVAGAFSARLHTHTVAVCARWKKTFKA
mgnify:CR=1 FL=1